MEIEFSSHSRKPRKIGNNAVVKELPRALLVLILFSLKYGNSTITSMQSKGNDLTLSIEIAQVEYGGMKVPIQSEIEIKSTK